MSVWERPSGETERGRVETRTSSCYDSRTSSTRASNFKFESGQRLPGPVVPNGEERSNSVVASNGALATV